MEAIKPENLHSEIGKTQSTSWFKVDQGMINAFADATDDQADDGNAEKTSAD